MLQSLFRLPPRTLLRNGRPNLIDTYRKIIGLLNYRERRWFCGLLVMFLFMGFLEVVGIASILPLLAVLTDSQTIQSSAYLAAAYDLLGFRSIGSFLLFLSVVVFIITIVRIASNALVQYATLQFSEMRNCSLTSRLLEAYLHQPYSWFLNRHTSDLGNAIISEVGEAVRGVMLPAMRLISQALVATLVIGFLIVVHPFISSAAAALVGGSFALVFFASRKYLSRLGKERVQASRERFKLMKESMDGIKEVKAMGMEDGYARRFRKPAVRLANCQVKGAVVAQVPRHFLEAVLFGGMLLLIICLLAFQQNDLMAILPILGLYAFAGYRLMPVIQQIFQSITSMRFKKAALEQLYDDIMMLEGLRHVPSSPPPIEKALSLRKSLELTNVTFTYPEAQRPALRDLTLIIPAKTTVAFVGATGAGKSTVVDIVLGLLQPQQGECRVDGVPITATNVRAWQRCIGYVPQQIFLADETVAGNIAFGIPEAKIDFVAVERAAEIAELHEFVSTQLPHGYNTMVGERGVRLSGGERQRIGIARALYNNPDVLLLDEATSALDNFTERAVMDAIRKLSHRKTIVLIAHRLTTVKECDLIFMLDSGRVSASGTYDELVGSSRDFRVLANHEF